MPYSRYVTGFTRSLSLALTAAFLVLLGFPAAPQASAELSLLSPNPAFLEAGRGAGRPRQEGFSGLRPSPIDWSYIKGAKVDDSFFDKYASRGGLSPRGNLPVSFDLSVQGKVTPVLSQGGWGTCWSFAALESAESSLLVETGEASDLSELHLGWYGYVDESPSKPAFTQYGAEPGENPIFDNGGTEEMVLALLSRGTGPAYESDAPYPKFSSDDEAWCDYVPNPAPPSGLARFHLREFLCFQDKDDIKRALMTLGGLSLTFYAEGEYMDIATGVAYCPVEQEPNHAVMLVGWDDTFPREKFMAIGDGANVPSSDGAWIIQNSWGTDNGDHGYYYISYEDKSILKDMGAIAHLMDPAGAYDGIYFHDPLGPSALVAGNSLLSPIDVAAETCNVFSSTRDEEIVSVGFVTANTNLDYQIQIYRHLDESGGPETGTPAWDAPQKGTAGPIGYRAVPLDKPVRIEKGERFAVAVSFTSTAATVPNDSLIVPVEIAVADYNEKAVSGPGESYVKISGKWEDVGSNAALLGKPFNLCVKAFTKSSGTPTGSSGGCGSAAYGAIALLSALFLLRKRA